MAFELWVGFAEMTTRIIRNNVISEFQGASFASVRN